MLTQDERNWLEENDVLDRHIFGRLTEEESARLQFLFDKDPSFQEEFDLNMAMAAAIRNKGRMELKERLKGYVEEMSQTSEGLSLHISANKPATRQIMPLWLKLAAAILVLAGASVVSYMLLFNKPIETPMAEEQTKQEKAPAHIEQPKEEIKQPIVPDESKKIAAKKGTSRQKSEEKPMIAATPPENLLQKRNQRFHAESLMMPKLNEVDATVIAGETKTEQPTKILFKNSTDLVAVNIKETQSEDNGKLHWFYVVYENRILNVYIDNSKYLTAFRNARLTESATSLLIEIKDAAYTVDLSSKDKFKKAVIKP